MNDSTQTGWQSNVKQVIRISMIGLEPGQQVTLKAYLRIILRVDFDIEWVTPKNVNTNLYIINNKFANADTVRALLQENNIPVLYVDKDDAIQNTIQNDVLYLKLEDIKPLEHWLHQNVSMIGPDGTYTNIRAVSKTDLNTVSVQPVTSQSQQETTNSQNLNAQSTTVQHTAQRTASTQPAAEHISEQTLSFLTLVNKQEADQYFSVFNGNDRVAIINPKRRLVWPQGDSFYPPYSLNWYTKPAEGMDYKPEHAMNLNQWLWQVALHRETSVSDILSQNAKLSLKIWPKPDNDSLKSAYLKILSLIELKPSSAKELSKLFSIDLIDTHDMLAALYLSGFIDTDGLPSIDTLARSRMTQDTTSMTAVTELNVSEEEHGMHDDAVLPNSEIQPQAVVEQIEQRKQVVKDSGGFGGLLSRIRSSLGF